MSFKNSVELSLNFQICTMIFLRRLKNIDLLIQM